MSDQPQKRTESRAREVTFFEDRARVLRVATVDVSAGANTVVVEGVSALIDDAGLLVNLSDEKKGSVQSAQVRRLYEDPQDTAEEEQIEEKARRELDQAAALLNHLHNEHRELMDLEDSLTTQMERVPATEGIETRSWAEAFEELDEPLAKVRTEIDMARRKRRDAERVHTKALQNLQEAQRKSPRLMAVVDVQVESEEDTTLELILEYFVPCALWRPSHRVRLTRGDNPRVEVTTMATVWQQTGESWSDIEARFSTARLSKPSSAPLLEDDVLISRQKSAEERKSIQATVRDQIISEMTEGARRTLDEMPGIDDGGRPLTFESSRPITLLSDGEPLQVDCAVTTLDVKLEALVYPELLDAPHLVARAVWEGDVPLLAGPMTLIRDGEFAGRTRQDFVAIGAPLRLGFGPENAVRLQRRVDESRGTARITGRQWIERKVHLFASNLSGQEQRFELIERVPVSELEEVTVTVDAGGRRPDADGFVRFSMVLAPRQTLEESLTYRLEFGAKVEMAL